MDEQQYYTIIIRHSDSTKWMISDPILTFGEYGVEDDTHRVKRGDGEKTWSELPYESFGLEYLITYSNLSGEVEDNEALVAALNKKISKDIFNDSQNGVITEISVSHTDGRIATFNKITKNISEGTNIPGVLHIKSADNSLEGYWTIDEQGAQILDLRARCAIDDYTPGLRYSEDQLCYYNNSLYRAKSNFTAEETFNESLWTLLCTLQSSGIKYDNRTSGLYANNVKDAIDELVVLDGTRVTKTRSSNKVYGTNDLGEQYLYDKDDLRTVDSVNGIRADVNKNIHLDAGQINYNDARPELGTVRNILDSKVDKNVAGEGAKILRGATLNLIEATGQIQLVKDKLSLEDGSSTTETDTINVVSETELTAAKTEINDRIDTEINTINDRIDTEVDTLNETIDTKEQALTDLINANSDEISRVELDSQTRDNTLDNRITLEVSTLNDRIDTEVETLNSTIDDEVADLNDTINAKETTLNNRITTEVGTLNNRITTEVNTLNESINTKIDKDIADNIVTGIEVATHDRQPTIKVTSNNTSSKRAVYDYIHFGTDGDIKTRMEDEDHLIIDSTDIDARIDANVTHLNLVDGRLDSHDTDIASLKEHDVNHDRAIAANSAQIAEHETRLDNLETDVDNLETDLTAEVTNRQTTDANLSTRIADNAVRIANNTQAIRDNADSIDQLAQTVEENIEALTNSKADKTFANTTDNKVVGKLESDNLVGSELLNLKQTLVSPVNGSSSVERIKIISSDNTVIAIRNNDGTIDLKTNLDTDVNYFVTSEILNTTIASVNTIQLNSLTPTDKQDVEVQDIISDPEGTWARVSSVDTTQGICTAITFKKHAQAVWGTIKGTLEDQQDLNLALQDIRDLIATEEQQRIDGDDGLQQSIDAVNDSLEQDIDNVNDSLQQEISNRESEDSMLQQSIDAVNDSLQQEITDRTDAESQIVQDLEDVKTDVSDLQDGKIDKTTDINKVYGTDENGEQTTYDKNDFGKVDTVNNVQPDVNKNVELTAADINHIKGNYSNNISQLLDTIIDIMFSTTVSNTEKIQVYVQDFSYTYSQDYGYIDSELNIQYTTDSERYVTYEEDNGVILMAKVMADFTSDSTQVTVLDSFMYDVEQGNLKLVGIPEQLQPTPPSSWDTIQTFHNIGSANISVEVASKTVNGNNYTRLNIINNTANEINASVTDTSTTSWYLDENELLNPFFSQDIVSNDNVYIYTNVFSDSSDVDRTYIEDTFTFETVLPLLTNLHLNMIDADTGDSIYLNDIFNMETHLVNDSTGGESSITEAGTTYIIYEGLILGNYTFNFTSDNYTIQNDSMSITVDTEGDMYYNVPLIVKSEPEDPEEVFDILDNVMGTTGDTYEGLGGTEEEVEEIFDQILGNPSPTITYPEIGDTIQVTLKSNPTIFTETLPANNLSLMDENYDGMQHFSVDCSSAYYSNTEAPVMLQGVEGASMLTRYTYEQVNGTWNWYVTELEGMTILSGPTIVNNPESISVTIPINRINSNENKESLYPIMLQYFNIEII